MPNEGGDESEKKCVFWEKCMQAFVKCAKKSDSVILNQ